LKRRKIRLNKCEIFSDNMTTMKARVFLPFPGGNDKASVQKQLRVFLGIVADDISKAEERHDRWE
jgi:hypothetical protein